jgi:hypothetical protein
MLTGTYTLVGFSGVKDYAIEGKSGTYARVSLRDSVGNVVEVKAEPTKEWENHIDEKLTIQFELRKGSFVFARFPKA